MRAEGYNLNIMNADTTPPVATPATPEHSGPATAEKPKANWKLLAALVGGFVIVAVLLVLVFSFLAYDPARTANLRDIVIIVAAFAGLVISLVIGAILAVLTWQIQSLIMMLRNEIKPMLTNVNQAVASVRGTTMLVSDNVAKPTIKIASWIAGLRGAGDALNARFTHRKR